MERDARESINIVKAAVENLPGGPVNVDVEDKLTIPDKSGDVSLASRG